MNHLHHLVDLTDTWNGPVSCSIFVPNEVKLSHVFSEQPTVPILTPKTIFQNKSVLLVWSKIIHVYLGDNTRKINRQQLTRALVFDQ